MRRRIIAGLLVAVVIVLAGVYFELQQVQTSSSLGVRSLSSPIKHEPPFLGKYQYIVHSGVLVENGSAYSYVVINSSALRDGDAFVALPALNTAIIGNSTNENNITMRVVYEGSPDAVPWINFSLSIPSFGFSWNFSHSGIGGSRSFASIDGLGSKAEVFAQTSFVIDENSWFEFYYYVGNSSTSSPSLAEGPPS